MSQEVICNVTALPMGVAAAGVTAVNADDAVSAADVCVAALLETDVADVIAADWVVAVACVVTCPLSRALVTALDAALLVAAVVDTGVVPQALRARPTTLRLNIARKPRRVLR